jgi:hypothetical protein
LLDNFGIQSLDHFCFENWRKFECKRGKSNFLCKTKLPRTTLRRGVPRRSHHRTVGRARQSGPATVGPRSGSASTVCLRGMTRCPPLGRCHAATAHSPPRAPPSAIGRRPAARRPSSPRHAVTTVVHDAASNHLDEPPGL